MNKKPLQHLPLLLLLAALTACSGTGQQEENDDAPAARLQPVETVIVQPDQFSEFIRVTGTVEALDDAVISSEVSGRILMIRDRGDRVAVGEPIARIDDRVIQAQFEAAKTALELAQDNFERLESLYADSIISTQDYNSARAQRDQARAQFNQAEKQLEDATISAPFTGLIEERFIREGELINPGMPVVRLVNISRVRILSGVPERFAGSIREGSNVVIEFRSLSETIRESSISYAGSVLDPETRTFAIEVELQNPGQRIKPEMVADLTIDRNRIENAIILPRTSIIRNEGGTMVFIASQRNGRKEAELIPVVTGEASGSLIRIVDGLSQGDEVVVSGMRNLNQGDELNILHSESSRERAAKLRDVSAPLVTF
ncbi:MAG: efflux RND transporter periplasmic adaptor subunit [Balneolaceae bacterium]